MTRYTTTTSTFGYRASSDYSDRGSVGDLEKAVISRILVRYEAFINELTVGLIAQNKILQDNDCPLKVFYVDSKEAAKPRGGGGTKSADIVLEQGEWIVRIEGGFLPQVISYLTFFSNKGSMSTAQSTLIME